MKDYYINNLSGSHLHQVYALADEGVKAYLSGEIDFCRLRLKPGDQVLELGCGYGRIVKALADPERQLIGIDNAPANIELATAYLRDVAGVKVELMSVTALGFANATFDAVLCLQNGLSAFGLDPLLVVSEAWRVTKPDGRLICSTYNEPFWNTRLAWFRRQAEAGLLGPIDASKTGNGVIQCTDGFVSRSTREQEFRQFAASLKLNVAVTAHPSGSLIGEYTQR